MNTPTRLLNRSAVRDFAFAVLAEKRPAWGARVTRISGEFYVAMEACLRNAIASHVERHPSVGKTIR